MTHLVVMVAPPGAGKSTWLAPRYPLATQRVCLDTFRDWCTDDEGDQTVNAAAATIQQLILAERLTRRLATAVDSTNINPVIRNDLVLIANRYGVPVVAVVLDTPLELCQRRNAARRDPVPAWKVELMWQQLHDEFRAPCAIPGFAVTRWVQPAGDRVFFKSLPAGATSWPALSI